MATRGTIFKATRDRDLYCEWSSVVDAPTWIGTRVEASWHLMDYYSPHDRRELGDGGAEQEVEDLLARVDEHGTSSRDGRHGGWEGKRADLIYLDAWWANRDRLGDLLDAYLAVKPVDNPAAPWHSPAPEPLVAAGVLEPIEDPT